MAEALARSMLEPSVPVYSAGSNPGRINPHVITVLTERGLDVSRARPKHVSEVPMDYVSTVVVMCVPHELPKLSAGTRTCFWDIPDPAAFEADDRETLLGRYRETRDRIASRVRNLIAELELRDEAYLSI